jgi:hypothetical protein
MYSALMYCVVLGSLSLLGVIAFPLLKIPNIRFSFAFLLLAKASFWASLYCFFFLRYSGFYRRRALYARFFSFCSSEYPRKGLSGRVIWFNMGCFSFGK